MRKIFYNLLLVSTVVGLFQACKKDEFKTFLQTGVPPTLVASKTTLVLSAATANDTVEAFSWSASKYGYNSAVKYTLQIAKGGTNFAAPKEISLGPGLAQKYAGKDLNQLVILQGLPFNVAGQVEVRVKSSISDSIPAIYSNVVAIAITPYQVIINYPSLWVAGDYQGWDPPSAPKISSPTDNKKYEGYVNIPAGGTLQFKLTSQADWNGTNYGWGSSTTTGNIVTGTLNTAGSAGNLFFPTAGYYVIKADIVANTWYVKKTTWALIGDAPTASNNWSNDVPMTYDAVNKVWTVTTNCVVGHFKFRANGDWSDNTNNFGDNGADLTPDYNGSDIAVPSAGMKTIKLDLHVPGQYSYSIQ
jgi:starch-binding outer membrane protein SusE/F